MKDILLEKFPSGPFETNAYLLACKSTKQCAIIDPAPESASLLLEFIQKHSLIPAAFLLTHSHWDHFGDLNTLNDTLTKNGQRLPIYVHPSDAKNLQTPGADGLPLLIPITGVSPTHLIQNGDTLDVGMLHLKVIHTPGHSPGGVCFYHQESCTLISGDTLFKGSIGNLSFSTAEPEKMWKSLDSLAQLPPETAVHPGHGPSTTIGEEGWLPEARKYFGNSF